MQNNGQSSFNIQINKQLHIIAIQKELTVLSGKSTAHCWRVFTGRSGNNGSIGTNTGSSNISGIMVDEIQPQLADSWKYI